MPSRRSLLAALGTGVTSLSGCLVLNDDTGTPTSTRHGAKASDTPTGEVTDSVITDVVVRKAITYASVMGSGGVLAGGQQYVVATVRADSPATDYEFSFEAGEESYAPGLPHTHGAMNRSVAGHGNGAAWESRSVSNRSPYYLAFSVPSPLEASDPLIRATGEETVERRLSDEGRKRLAAPEPRFELDSLAVPEEVSEGEPLSVSVTVTNVSETDGRFLAAAYWPTELIADDDESHVVEREMAAGRTATVTTDIQTEYTARGDGPVRLSIEGHVQAEREIELVDTSTPS